MATPTRYSKILVPLDGTGWSARAVVHAAEIARGSGDAEVILLHIFTPPARQYVSDVALASKHDSAQQAREAMKRYLIGARSELRGENLRARTHLIEGTGVAELICEYVRNEGVDLIVMATHRRRSLARLFLGSVTQEVVGCVDVPVLLIDPNRG